MADTMQPAGQGGDNGHTGSVDARLAREHGGRPATWHARRYGPNAVNGQAARIIRAWRAGRELAALAEWIAPIESALGTLPTAGGSARLRAALADAAEDEAEARYMENPSVATARVLLRKRAADRLASLDHDREIAELHGLML